LGGQKATEPNKTYQGALLLHLLLTKRKRKDGKTKVVSKEEEAALKEQEAARKRVEDKEKPLMGLYKTY
jgi:WW domain-binding protein 4